MKTLYRIVWHQDGEVWWDDMVYSSESKAARAGERECRSNPDLWFTIDEAEACDDEEADD